MKIYLASHPGMISLEHFVHGKNARRLFSFNDPAAMYVYRKVWQKGGPNGTSQLRVSGGNRRGAASDKTRSDR